MGLLPQTSVLAENLLAEACFLPQLAVLIGGQRSVSGCAPLRRNQPRVRSTAASPIPRYLQYVA